MIEPIEFKVKFITPLLIHGANSREADTIGLTGKALRGCWRFWNNMQTNPREVIWSNMFVCGVVSVCV